MAATAAAGSTSRVGTLWGERAEQAYWTAGSIPDSGTVLAPDLQSWPASWKAAPGFPRATKRRSIS